MRVQQGPQRGPRRGESRRRSLLREGGRAIWVGTGEGEETEGDRCIVIYMGVIKRSLQGDYEGYVGYLGEDGCTGGV